MKNSKIIISIVIVLCLVIAGYLGISMYNSSKDNQNTQTDTNEVKSEGKSLEEADNKIEGDDTSVHTDTVQEVDETEDNSDTDIAATTKPQGTWNMILETEVTQTVRMAAFLDENIGVTGGFSSTGKLHYTTDGGKTWTKNEESGGCIYGVEIVDSNTVWVCGRMKGVSFTTPGGLRLSTDGGKTLGDTADYTTSPGKCPLSFLDDMRGWICQLNKVSETLDGGLSFNEISLPDDIGNIVGVAVYEDGSSMTGCVLSEDGVLMSTNDQGNTWSNRSELPLKERYDGYKIAKYESAATAIRFFDKDNALVVVSLTGDKIPVIVAFRTEDGGKTWTDELVCEGEGSIYLSPDGRYVTSLQFKTVTVHRYDED
ncbi:hypothetical protein I5677_01930 [Mobilitalea sibirica]|uniref:Photosynthesis system II assembly factor Ycf48/Hcf136-like domain-containing protein n=1 Tax=Mobilitalea sibirica TaxID=1462919 RepID=A0A8J7H7R7_9FIRM|nr:hypothetical protein [Mobilitalea sibirica]MBH1939650.1 hypothetical protein [Mobilitalea sibirica]